MTKLLLLDKDGTLVRPKSGGEFVQHPEDQELLPGVTEAIARYAADGWTMAIVSNQGGVAAGYKTLDDAIAEMQYCLRLLPEVIRTVVFCPDSGSTVNVVKRQGHRKYLSDLYTERFAHLGFRKPSIGMIATLQDFCTPRDDTPSEMLMIGDRPIDQQSAAAANIPFMWANEWLKTDT